MKVSKNKKIELIGVLSNLSSYDERFTNLIYPKRQYKKSTQGNNVRSLFKEFEKHPAVLLFDELTTNPNFMFDGPLKYILDYQTINNSPYYNELIIRSDRKKLNKLTALIDDFVNETNYDEYFQSIDYSEIYKELNYIYKREIIKRLNDYLGQDIINYQIIPTPLLRGNYGITSSENGKKIAYAIITPCNSKDFIFGDEFEIIELVIHEFLHSHINDLTEQHSLNIEYKDLSISITKEMMNKAYSNKKSIIDENIIRSITIRILDGINKRYSEELLLIEQENGFEYINDLINKLKIYENNRNKYSEIGEYYLKLINVFT